MDNSVVIIALIFLAVFVLIMCSNKKCKNEHIGGMDSNDPCGCNAGYNACLSQGNPAQKCATQLGFCQQFCAPWGG